MNRLSLCFFLLLSLFLFSCNQAKREDKKPLIIVSIPPYESIIKAIAGTTVSIQSAIPPGYDPHTSELTFRQMDSLRGAALWIGIGEAYEKALLKALKNSNPSLSTLTLHAHLVNASSLNKEESVGNCLHLHAKENDLHFWLSIKQLRPQAVRITKMLSHLWPKNQFEYENNLKNLLRKMDELEKKISSLLSPLKGKTILVSHAALSYFCQDYELIQLALECHGKNPLPQTISTLTSIAKKKRPICAFAFPHHNDKALLSLAKELHIPIYHLDLLQPDLFSTILQIAKDISHAAS